MTRSRPSRDSSATRPDTLGIEHTRLLYANLPTAVGANFLLAMILVYVQRTMIDKTLLFGWLAAVAAISTYRIALAVFWHRNGRNDMSQISSWRYRFRVGVIVSGSVWSLSSVLLFPTESVLHQVFHSFILAGLSAGAVTSLAVDKLSVITFVSLVLIPLIVRFMLEDTEIFLSMGIMTVLFLFIITQNAARVRHAIHETIRLRVEASFREEALQEGKVRLQQLNQNLEKLVTERTAELADSEARFRFLFEQVAVGVAQVDIKTNRFVRTNRKHAEIVGYTHTEILAFDFRTLFRIGIVETDLAGMECLHTGEIRELDLERRISRKDGRSIWVHLTISPMWMQGMQPDYHIVVIQDITDHKRAEEQVHQLAFYDPLTRLPNRRLFLDRLQQAQAHSTRHDNHCALLFIDLDNFKALNDTRGHDIGDLLLVEIAKRLRDHVRSGDTVARLGGDEFVIIVEELNRDAWQAAAQAQDIGEKLLAAINEPFMLQEFEYHGSSSIGIRLFHDGENRIDDLLKHADTAMYQAKTAGRNALSFFDPSMQTALEERTEMALELRQAIERQQFRLHYQQQVNAEGVVVGAEVLLRWQHPEWGTISPMVFIPIAEETGLIVPIGKWVLRMACTQLRRWEDDPRTRSFQLAVNISARQFRQTDFTDEVLEVLGQSGADPLKLKLELTESLVLQDVAHSIGKMEILCNSGIRFALDDFGTGHSSLAYLKRLPLEQIKIDRSFVNDITTDPSDEIIVRTIIGMSNSLGMDVIAEGVETEAQRDFLARNGCYAYQGYLFGKPMPIEDFQACVAPKP